CESSIGFSLWLESRLVGLAAGPRALEIADEPFARQLLAAQTEGQGQRQRDRAEEDHECGPDQIRRDAELLERHRRREGHDRIAGDRRQHLPSPRLTLAAAVLTTPPRTFARNS